MKKEKLLEKLKSKYRLTIYHDHNLEEINTFTITKLNVFVYVIFLIVFVGFLSSLIMVYTPLNMLMPSQVDISKQREIIENSMTIDSLSKEIAAENFYLNQVKNVLQGKFPTDTLQQSYSVKDKQKKINDLNFSSSDLDSVLRTQIEQEENSNLSAIDKVKSAASIKNLHFFMPVKGVVTNKFDFEKGHFGIDIVAAKDQAIMATLSGTVIMATWSLETGYVIEIQHRNNLISIYKHNSVLLKQTGDRVEAGESIAIIGNSGEQTTGPHLHFELWHNGVPLNPSDYIAF
jgi:murein DD-endopeptidase MepM/ murein hydrolase activator NlpD